MNIYVARPNKVAAMLWAGTNLDGMKSFLAEFVGDPDGLRVEVEGQVLPVNDDPSKIGDLYFEIGDYGFEVPKMNILVVPVDDEGNRFEGLCPETIDVVSMARFLDTYQDLASVTSVHDCGHVRDEGRSYGCATCLDEVMTRHAGVR